MVPEPDIYPAHLAVFVLSHPIGGVCLLKLGKSVCLADNLFLCSISICQQILLSPCLSGRRNIEILKLNFFAHAVLSIHQIPF